jgi:uncharacterized protein (DUF433 family)
LKNREAYDKLIVMKYRNRITIDQKIMVGKPVIKGTRIPVELIIELLAQKIDVGEILKQYPRLTRKDVQAALYYAQDILSKEQAFSLNEKEAFKNIQFA